MEMEPKYKKKSRWWLYILACLLAGSIVAGIVIVAYGTSPAIDYDGFFHQFSKLRVSIICALALLVTGLIWHFRHQVANWCSDVFAKLSRRTGMNHKSVATVITVKDNWWRRKSARLGKRFEYAWNNHRGWFFSGGAALGILVATIFMFRTQGAVVGTVAMSAGKIIGGITWGIILLILLMYAFRRFTSLTAVVWAMIGSVTVVALAVLATVIGYAKHASFYWWPLAALAVLAAIVGGLWWMRKSSSTPTPTPVPGTPQPNTPARAQRTGPPPLIIILIMAIDFIVIFGHFVSATWQWPFFHWSSTATGLWSWRIMFVVLLTLLTFFADWGQPDRPNSVRRFAANIVAIGFMFGLAIASLGALLAVVTHIRW